MRMIRFPQFASKTALLAMLLAASACAELESTYDDIMGNDPKPAVKTTTVKTPAAAPVQGVETIDNSKAETVELGSIRDNSLDNTPRATPEAPEPAAKPTPAPAAPAVPVPSNATVGSASLLTIRFNQPHVYYDDALANAVKLAENTKSGVVYDVLSTVPDLSSLPVDQQEKLANRAKENLRNVVMKMQQLGIPASRINIADQTVRIRSQEIQLFVH